MNSLKKSLRRFINWGVILAVAGSWVSAQIIKSGVVAQVLVAGVTTRVSVASDGTQGNDSSWQPALSSDGRYIAFISNATNLVQEDSSYWGGVYVHDRQTRETTVVSVASDGTQGFASFSYLSISGDGRFVAFVSTSANLVEGDTNNEKDVFVYDRQSGETRRVSVSSDGTQGNSSSDYSSISSDGGYIAFSSYADNLVQIDENSWYPDVFIHNLETGETILVSIATDGTQGNGSSQYPSISSDGRYVAFTSWSDNLVTGDTNRASDIFVHDRETGITTRVSISSDRIEGNSYSNNPSISTDGRYVAFISMSSNLVWDTNWYPDVFVHDRETGATTRVSVASDGSQSDGHSYSPTISADGRYVAFASEARNLVPADTNNEQDIFVHDRQTGETTRMSVAFDGVQGDSGSASIAISADGRYIAFSSLSSNLVLGDTNGIGDVFVRDRFGEVVLSSISGRVTDSDGMGIEGATVSASGWRSATTDGDGVYTIELLPEWQYGVSVGKGGYTFVPAVRFANLPPDGTGLDFVGDGPRETNLVSVASNGTQGNLWSYSPAISADGRFIAFTSDASNLVPGDSNGYQDVFLHDRQTDETRQVSVSSDGTHGNYASLDPTISADGRYVAFTSWSANLVPGDTNERSDVFVYDRQTGQTTRVSVASDGSQGEDESGKPSISADGRYIAFSSWANNLVSGDMAWVDIFVHDRQTAETTIVSVSSDGTKANAWSESPSISGDGRYVAFTSWANNLVEGDINLIRDVFVHDRLAGETMRVSVASDGTPGNDYSGEAVISSEGRVVAFTSSADNLVFGDINGWKDVFVHDLQTGETELVSKASDGRQGNYECEYPAISAEGRYVAFHSYANNLIPGDTNERSDVFVHDGDTGYTARVSVASDGAQGSEGSSTPAITADGEYVAFSSTSDNLVPVDVNDFEDIFVHGPAFEYGTPPLASFDVQPALVSKGTEVQFINTTVGIAPIVYTWDFGDGGTSTQVNPTHIYAEAGTNTVMLTATNDYGSGTASAEILVLDPVPAGTPPTTGFTITPVTPVVEDIVVFTNSTVGDEPVSFAWSFGDGGTSTLVNPTHIYTEAGTYTVTLAATNDYGSNMASANIQVLKKPAVKIFLPALNRK